jgi:ABC-type polysaccharide/polyol phosphate export permease
LSSRQVPAGSLPVYDSAGRRPRAIEEALGLWSYRALVIELALKDIKIRYKRSALGVFWTMLAPLLNMIVLTIVFSTLMKMQIANYPVYYMTGLLFWLYFSQTTSSVALQTHEANEMAKRIYVPRSVFVGAAVVVGLVNLALSIVPLLILLLATGFPLHATWAFLPISILIATLFTAGVSFFLYTLGSGFSDVREMYLILVQALFFLTPVVYHPSIVPANMRAVLWLNPMYYLIQLFRRPIYDGALPSLALIALSTAISVVCLISGFLYFSRHVNRLAFQS